MSTYFTEFPTIEYANSSCKDITKRIKIVDSINSNPYIYYPYNITNNERHDQISDQFWDNNDLGWLIFLSNQIIDPYYQWYLQDSEFNDFILKKYKTLEQASKIKEYRIKSSDEIISIERYNELAPHEYKYWGPYYESTRVISGYKRKNLDWIVNTNAIVKYTFITQSQSLPKINDKIKVKINPDSIGTFEVIATNKNFIIGHHIMNDAIESENITVNNSSYIYDDNINIPISDINVIKYNILLDDFKYWEPVTFYEWEIAKNEYNKSLRIMNPQNVPSTIKEFKELMK